MFWRARRVFTPGLEIVASAMLGEDAEDAEAWSWCWICSVGRASEPDRR